MELAIAGAAVAGVLLLAYEMDKKSSSTPPPNTGSGSNDNSGSDTSNQNDAGNNQHKGVDTSGSSKDFQPLTPANTAPPPVTAPPPALQRWCWMPVRNNTSTDWIWAARPVNASNPPCTGEYAPPQGYGPTLPVFAGYFDPNAQQWVGSFTDTYSTCGKYGIVCQTSLFGPPPYGNGNPE